jgi:PAS domain S-box-containing protein
MAFPFRRLLQTYLPGTLIGAAVLAGLFWMGQSNYLLFHVLSEIFSVVIAMTIFVLTWNGRRFFTNGYLLFLGISFFFTGLIDLLHTLAYRGMGVFPGTGLSDPDGANLPTQLWLAARYLQGLALALAPLFVRQKPQYTGQDRRLRDRLWPYATLLGFGTAAALLLLSIYVWRSFPDALLDATGLTPFKIGSEYVIILLMVAGGLGLWRHRRAFDPDVRRLLLAGIVFTVLSELAFVEYLAVTDDINLLGHLFKIVAFYLIYHAIIVTGFLRPHDLLFRELAQSELALRDSEQRERSRAAQLEAVMDVAPAVVLMAHDAAASRVTGNRASAAILGIPAGANLSLTAGPGEAPTHFRVFDREGQPLAPHQLPLQAAAGSGRPVEGVQLSLALDSGIVRHLYGNAAPLLDAQGQPAGAVGVFIDITERVQAEEAMLESERRYRSLFETMAESFSLHDIIYDDQGRAVDYTIHDVNPAFERLTRLSRDHVVGKTIREIVPGVRFEWIERYARVARTGVPERFEDYSTFLDKYFEVMIYRAGPGQVAALTVDVTDRYRSQEALRQSEARLRRLVDSNIIGILYADAEGRIYLANDAFLEMVGYTRVDFDRGGVNWSEITPPEYQPLDHERIREAVERGACTPYEKEYIRPDGSRVPVLIGYAYFESGMAPFICFVVDLTLQKQAEQSARAYAEQMERYNRDLARANSELENFAFVASHDLQEPLRKIQAFGERLALRSKTGLDDESRDYLERMLASAGRMRQMINDLLSLSRITTRARPFQEADLNLVLQDVLSDLEVRIERSGAQVEVGPLAVIQADVVQMRQLFQNLIANALKFVPKDQPPRVRIVQEWTGEGKSVIINVEDNGIGFDEMFLERIFQPFQRLHGRGEYEGSGIGLAVCRKIVERHAGHITARSAPGQGTNFIITLPVRQPENEPAQP